jgi:hypothetical protein
MAKFARWVGKMAAGAAALLAALWIWQAQPDDSPAGRDLARMLCRAALMSGDAAAAANSPLLGPDFRARLLECERNPRLRWNQALLDRGLGSGAAAVLFLLLAALVPAPAASSRATRLAEEEAEALEVLISEELAKAPRETGRGISRQEALIQARRRLHG